MRLSVKLRVILLVLLICGILLPNQLFADDVDEFLCGHNFIHRDILVKLPPGELRLRLDTDVEDKRLSAVNLNPGPTLAANADALAAFNRAINTWISWFDDPVTIDIDADLVSMGPGVLGAASSTTYQTSYNDLRDQMVSDADINEAICSSLPTLAQFNVITATGFNFVDQMTATKANFRALGYNMSSYPDPDASIDYNSDRLADFDFDRSDGIDSDKYDFEGIVLHELGHVLGYGSRITSTDYWINEGTPTTTKPRPLDLFRLEPGQGAANFTSSSRIQVPANPPGDPSVLVQMTYDGSSDLMMSTGRYYGDGRQNSHWKDNSLTGNYLGLMDPTLGKGDQVKPLKNDIIALGLSGWDVGQGPCDGISYGDCNNDGLTLTVADVVYMQRYLIGDAPHYNNLCSYELNHYDNPFFPCEPTFGDLLFYTKYTFGSLTFNDLNSECQYTELPESYGLNIVMPSNVDLSSSFSDVYTIQLENNNVIPIYVYALTVPVRFPYTGGTGTDIYTFTNVQDYGTWTVFNPINLSGTPAIQFITNGSPVTVPALSTIDLFDVNYNWVYASGSPVMSGELFAEIPGRFPVATVSTTPKSSGSRQPHWLMEVTLGSTLVPYGCDCEPGEVNVDPPMNILDIVYIINYKYKSGPPPAPYALCSGDTNCDCLVNILDIVYLINYKYKSGPAPCDCITWLGICGPPLRK